MKKFILASLAAVALVAPQVAFAVDTPVLVLLLALLPMDFLVRNAPFGRPYSES